MNVQQMARNYVDNPDPRKNYDGFVVIGAGLPRTGTMSMRAALTQLLDGACHHMLTVMIGKKEDCDFWNNAIDGKVKDQDWVNFLEKRGYRSGVDYPISMFYKELMRAFPNAKVVLTVRNPDTWQASIKNTICKIKDIHYDFACSLFNKLTGTYYVMDTMVRISDNPLQPMGKSMLTAVEEGKESGEKFFNDWVEDVKRVVPKERLLVFEVKQGWKPLCEFLDLPIPEGDFPRVNDTQQALGMLAKMKYTAYLTIYGVPLISAALGYWYTFM